MVVKVSSESQIPSAQERLPVHRTHTILFSFESDLQQKCQPGKISLVTYRSAVAKTICCQIKIILPGEKGIVVWVDAASLALKLSCTLGPTSTKNTTSEQT
jgi:hypothetical protein